MKRLLSLVIILILGTAVFAQYRDDGNTPSLKSRFTQPQSGLFDGLLNMNNLDMSHSISMGYASSSGGSVMTGTYLNSMRYKLSSKMLLNMNLGFMTQPYSSYNNSGYVGADNTQFIGGAELVYRPSNKFMFSVGFNNMPFYYSNRGYSNHLYNYPYSSFSYPWDRYTPSADDMQP